MESEKNKNSEDSEGPSVDSSNQVERIEARRKRIQKRIEAAKREALGEKVAEKIANYFEEELRKSRRQIEDSYQRLLKLKNDGSELVSNVQVACHAREDIRRTEEDEVKRQRIEKLETEAKSAVDKFEEITKKWDLASSKETPQDLHEMLVEQRTGCDAMIDEKNKLINELQQDLKAKDDQYVKDLRKQAEDIDLMIERMEEQVKTLLQAYHEELTQIEKSFDTERRELIENHKKRWSGLMNNRHDKEVNYMDSRQRRVDDFENQLQNLRVQDAEEYNMVKIKLETDVQILEQNLQQMKATYQLNQEKLEYNFQVLKKRDEENTITKSQQKRKITRLQDLLNNLKQKSKKQEKQYSDENHALTEDLKRITEQYKELQKKFRHFQATDEKKFRDIWLMNEERAKTLVGNVLEQDRIVHEHQLGLQYDENDLDFLKNVGPLQPTGEIKKRSAAELVEEILSGDSTSTRTSASQKSAAEMSMTTGTRSADKTSDSLKEVEVVEEELSNRKIKEMLELLCDEAGFLVEGKLLKLLSPLEQDEQSLMKLDAIFSALGIETEDDIRLLTNYFYKLVDLTESSTYQFGESHGEGNGNQTVFKEGASQPNIKEILIHPNEVLQVLRTFAEDHREPHKDARRTSFRLGVGPTRDDSQDEDYWRMFPAVIGEKKERLWDALIQGFEKYNETLTERAKLIQTTTGLRQQNSELRMLLHQYINSRINQELEIPPTKVLQIDGK
ncbi:dynein regulatory complex protein 1-like [Rhopilema esculentum]|uniref:dynein regulatory complex protein 1-like n=1 Tax=Rhopilema esculentum TaxID=499914 RepID=UPI0031D0F32D